MEAELFKIGFLSITLFDLIDIGMVAALFLWLYSYLKDSMAVQILFGLVILIGLKFIAEAVNLRATNWILNTISNVWLLAFIILFQPELRKLMLIITRSKIFRLFVRSKIRETLDDIVDAVAELSSKHIGALIVFPRSQNVQMTIDSGIRIQAFVTKELLISIFSTKSPLHDGAVVIENQTLVAARCILPLSNVQKMNGRNLGTRHRAGLGLTEQIDALVLIVSEETGYISITDGGEMTSNINIGDLLRILEINLYENDKNTRDIKG